MVTRLNVNIDHVATVRQARRAPEPSLAAAAALCESAGADGITVHLRGDRRHVQDEDLRTLRRVLTTYLNAEMAATDEMLKIALDVRPDCVTLVSERADELTTEGGMDVRAGAEAVRVAVGTLREGGILTSLFIDPEAAQIAAAREAGAQQVELCTAAYAEATLGGLAVRDGGRGARELQRLREAARLAAQHGLQVAAGHGLTYRNVGAVAAIPEIIEFNIGHNIVSRAVLVGMERAVGEMRERIREGSEAGPAPN
jgi:pyridoxine 5-phosphate synthase